MKTTCQSGNEREEMDADDELNTDALCVWL